MQEIYPAAKSEYPDLPSKDLISLVAKRWKDLDLEGKAAWKDRAQQQQQQQDESREQNIPNKNGEEYSYPPRKDIDTMDHEETQEKDKDNQVGETGDVSNSHLEENRDQVDNEGIPNDLAET